MDQTALCYTPATDLTRAIRARELSPVELTDAVLARIAAVNPKINAYCTLVAEQARAGAREAEEQVMRGAPLGPLHGLPISIKDLTPTAGIRTTSGSKVFEHDVPADDALVVARVKAAGAILLGKTNTSELGSKGVTENLIFGATRNPWDLARTPFGSSGGAAAAVAAGLSPLAQGTDYGGSIRVPAAACGVVGLKPSATRVARDLANYDTIGVDGPLARTVRDVALLLNVIAGPDDRDPSSLPATGEDFVAACDAPLGTLRVAWTPDLEYAAVEPPVMAIAGAAARAFADLGCEVVEAHPGFADPADLLMGFGGIKYASSLAEYLPEWSRWMDAEIIRFVRAGQDLTAVDYERLYTRRNALYQQVRRFFERYDLLLTPATAVLPFAFDAPYPPPEVAGRPLEVQLNLFPFCYPFNLTGHPAIVVPAGWTGDGLPVGLQIVGRRRADATVLRAAAAYEALRPWTGRRPAL
jgi:Asp-tRNA(Asn)/Glu-tRNA(Gln) amidotransferase A subunit family amidase